MHWGWLGMLVVKHEQKQYKELKGELTKPEEDHFSTFVHVSSAIHRYWSDVFSVSELQVLMFIVGRTLSFSKRAETIAFRHFLEGVEQGGRMVCAPCGLKEKAVRAALKTLVGRGYVRIHAFFQGNVESLWRIYEVNSAKLLELSSMSLGKSSAQTGKKQATRPLLSKGTPPSSQRGPISNIKESSTSTNVEVSAARLPTPKRARAKTIADECNQFENPADLVKHLAAQAQERRANRSNRASAMPTKRWSSLDLQALLDKARERAEAAGYSTPRVVVTARPLPTLHKRMLAAEIADPLAFFTWTLQHWGTIASANRRSKARQAKETRAASEAMSMAPNFNDLSYRFPYIVAFYNDREQAVVEDRRQVQQQEQKVEKSRKATEVAINARREAARELDLKREEERRKESETAARRLRRRPKARVEDDSEERPVFVEPVWSGK